MVLTVEFHADRLPVGCSAFYQGSAGDARVPLQEFAAGRQWVRLVRASPSPGIYGIRWAWG